MEDVWIYVIGIVVPVMTGLILGIFIVRSINSVWYQSLSKPPFHPPDWLIPFSFTVLNGLMGYGSCRVFLNHDNEVHGAAKARLATIAYIVKFFVKGIWPIMFFICRKTTLSFIQIIIVDAAVLFCVKLFFSVDVIAGYVAIPHLLWTFWWTILLYSIWLLNYHHTVTEHEAMLSTEKPLRTPAIRQFSRNMNRSFNRSRSNLSSTPGIKTYGVFI